MPIFWKSSGYRLVWLFDRAMAVYSVLIAKDEILVRLGLKNSVDWESYSMEVAD